MDTQRQWPTGFDANDWYYTGHCDDLGEPSGVCALCEQIGLRYYFYIASKVDSTTPVLNVGSECIKRWDILAVDGSGKPMGALESRLVVEHDRRQMIQDAKERRLTASLEALAAKGVRLDIASFIKYFRERGAFTPNQLLLLLSKLKAARIAHTPTDFKVIIRREREKQQLKTMRAADFQLLLPCLSNAQKEWAMANRWQPPVEPTHHLLNQFLSY